MSAKARGNQRENAVARIMREEGYVVASMRQSLGGGDLMAARGLNDGIDLRLVEVKGTAAGPYATFSKKARREMLEYARLAGASAHLAWWPPKGKLTWIPSHKWPNSV